jgi:adenylyltransferase/sulfurtransferase
VFGVLPGVIGAIQATEAIKLILGIGETLIGKLLLYDALRMEFRFLKLRKDPKCPLCGENKTITELQDYEVFCGLEPSKWNEEYSLFPKELKQRLEEERNRIVILDVRDPHEWEISAIEGSLFIPLAELPHKLSSLDPTKEYVVVCKVGQRSLSALDLLLSAGLKAYNLKGGINAWAKEVDSSLPVY